MPERNVLTWKAMISGYLRNGDTRSASLVFEEMQGKTQVTWSQIRCGFVRNGDIVTTRRLFDEVFRELKDVLIWTVMVDGGLVELLHLAFGVVVVRFLKYDMTVLLIELASKRSAQIEPRVPSRRGLVRVGNRSIGIMWWNLMMIGIVKQRFVSQRLPISVDAVGFSPAYKEEQGGRGRERSWA
ncbi:pentatricopeptide repeat-containing protein At5g08305-like [Vigna umbellata]|uniref:pentatricopeptide repeat-containing protein At5g08305-like n=1 Tax=Vigna umbellata TaxID=87088 RepID=UPI001F5ECB4C|nr:pentatricopeptide repeat-containing protein At5g08305-like [Vigna umbellata]